MFFARLHGALEMDTEDVRGDEGPGLHCELEKRADISTSRVGAGPMVYPASPIPSTSPMGIIPSILLFSMKQRLPSFGVEKKGHRVDVVRSTSLEALILPPVVAQAQRMIVKVLRCSW